MKRFSVLFALLLLIAICILPGCNQQCFDPEVERPLVEQSIRNSIEWALDNKNTEALYGSMMQDSTLFWFQPDSRGTVQGFDQFTHTVETVFLDDRFEATRTDISDLKITFSACGSVAWYSCILDDYGTWDGREIGWEDCRWTGVLEKIDGQWRIRQQHFSLAEDQIRAEVAREMEEG